MYQAPRGTRDILPEEQPYWRYIEQKAAEICQLYGYQRIDTPIFEDTGLFTRGIGEETDIVEKEMYAFRDQGGTSLTLRPEGTAPVCRAYLEWGMHNLPQPVRLYYFAPIFRYERPQAGRYRQHHQFGFEALGSPDPVVDAEVVDLAWYFYQTLGLKDLVLKLNSIGCPRCRPAWVGELRSFYRERQALLCSDCQRRLEKNPLRLLDCKQEVCSALARQAPRSFEFLCSDCREHFERLRNYLSRLGLEFELEPRLVRGLDYYTRTVFEIQPPGEGRAQATLGGGGRYDGLIEAIGGKSTPGVGFATGVERIILNLKKQEVPIPSPAPPAVFLAYLGQEAKERALEYASQLRRAGVGVVLASDDRSLKAQLRQASRLQASFALILGEDELREGKVVWRDMRKGEQQRLDFSEVLDGLIQVGGSQATSPA